MKQQINKFWRLFGTGLSFTVFGLGGLVVGVVVLPVLLIVMNDREKRQALARNIVGKCFGAFVWLMKSLGVLSYKIEGLPESPPAGNCLIIANHPTLIDVVFLISMFPHANCVIKSALWRNPFTRGALAAANYIPNDGGAEVIELCTERLRDGATLILFPEGTRTVPNQALQFKMGAAAIAVHANARLLPVAIQCVPLTLYKHDPWHNTPATKPQLRFKVLPSVSVQDLAPTDRGQRHQRRLLNQALTKLFEDQLASGF